MPFPRDLPSLTDPTLSPVDRLTVEILTALVDEAPCHVWTETNSSAQSETNWLRRTGSTSPPVQFLVTRESLLRAILAQLGLKWGTGDPYTSCGDIHIRTTRRTARVVFFASNQGVAGFWFRADSVPSSLP